MPTVTIDQARIFGINDSMKISFTTEPNVTKDSNVVGRLPGRRTVYAIGGKSISKDNTMGFVRAQRTIDNMCKFARLLSIDEMKYLHRTNQLPDVTNTFTPAFWTSDEPRCDRRTMFYARFGHPTLMWKTVCITKSSPRLAVLYVIEE